MVMRVRRLFFEFNLITDAHPKVKSEKDRFIRLVEEAVSLFAVAAAPGSFLVNVVPFRTFASELL